MLTADAPTRPRHVDLILQRIDALPTLPAVATKLLAVTAREDSDAREVIELVRGDQTLTAAILSLCRRSDLGIREEVLTVERAVVLLGFNTIRNAVLSVQVFELFDPPTRPGPPAGFDRAGFWRHSMAVAAAAECIAQAHPNFDDIPPAEAFVCGLLHDIGKLAIDHLLPTAFAKVVALAELNQGDVAEFERRVVGLDHHTAGKRLAEQWKLPAAVKDCIWLHGSPVDSLPALPHQRMIGLVALADLIARRYHLGFSGNFVLDQDPRHLAALLGLNPARVEQAVASIHEQVHERCVLLGLDGGAGASTRQTFLTSIQQANQALGRLNSALERRSRLAARQGRCLAAIRDFCAATAGVADVREALGAVARSAAAVLGTGRMALIYPRPGAGAPTWLVIGYNERGAEARAEQLQPPTYAPELGTLDAAEVSSLNLVGLTPWIADVLDDQQLRSARLLPMTEAAGPERTGAVAALLLHTTRDGQASELAAEDFGPLVNLWAWAITWAGRHESSRQLSEQLVEAHHELAQAQEKLVSLRSLARLGEMAAGAAHEMNNPLAVISGRCQLLNLALTPGSEEQKAAAVILEQSHRLSDLITSLRLFAHPPQPNRKKTCIRELLDDLIRHVRADLPATTTVKSVSLQLKDELPDMNVDGEMIGKALLELLHNAIQSQASHVTVTALLSDNALVVEVTDDGCGMDGRTLRHAMDPFFSAKPAGRRAGLGLPRAGQYAAAHQGRIELRSAVGQGTTATLWVPLD